MRSASNSATMPSTLNNSRPTGSVGSYSCRRGSRERPSPRSRRRYRGRQEASDRGGRASTPRGCHPPASGESSAQARPGSTSTGQPMVNVDVALLDPERHRCIPLADRDRDLDRTDLPPAPPAGRARPFDARRVRGHHEHDRRTGGVTTPCHLSVQQSRSNGSRLRFQRRPTCRRCHNNSFAQHGPVLALNTETQTKLRELVADLDRSLERSSGRKPIHRETLEPGER